MIIYIPLEISVRELQGHLLFAIHAAARGHQTMIAAQNDIWLFKRLGVLPKGAYLVKNVNVPSNSALIYKNFRESGFDIYCQDQEPSILWGEFERFLFDHNITRNQMMPFKAVFCWGARDTLGYQRFFESFGEVFVDTGATRSDLWNPRFSTLRSKKEGNRKYILFVSNFGYWLGKRHWTEWFSAGHSNEILQSLHQEDSLLNFFLEDSAITLNMIRAIRHMADRFPDFRIVVRPHPLDFPMYWQHVLGDHPNIELTDNTSPLTNWIDGASAVIQNGCTSSIEAVLMKVPLVSYGPERHQGDLKIPGMLGLKAATLDDLESAIKVCLDAKSYAQIQETSEAILKPIITSDSGESAIRMLQVMEERSTFDSVTKISGRLACHLGMFRVLKHGIDSARGALKLIDIQKDKIKLNRETIMQDFREMSRILGLPVPAVTIMSHSGMIVGPFKQK